MSITRLQQARQMYAMGKRVGRIAFGGGGSQDHQGGGYQGSGSSNSSSSSSSSSSPSSSGGDGGNDGPSYHGGGADPMPVTPVTETFPTNLTGGITVSTDPLDLKEQYNLGNIPTKTGVVTFNNPYVSNQLETIRKNNYIDKLNLKGATYQPPNLPFFVPGSTLIKTLGSFGFNKNKNFFSENVAGKYGYGYGLEAFEKYMADRTSGKVGAYGNEEQGQNALSGQGGGEGIMNVVDDTTDDTTEDTTDDTTNEDGSLILRYLHDNPNEVVNLQAMGVKDTDEMLQVMLDRAKNLYTT